MRVEVMNAMSHRCDTCHVMSHRLHLIGHSLGGGAAALLAMLLRAEGAGRLSEVRVQGFGFRKCVNLGFLSGGVRRYYVLGYLSG